VNAKQMGLLWGILIGVVLAAMYRKYK